MIQNWSNTDNTFFYENGCHILQNWSQQGGLASCPDLQAIKDYIIPATQILELGAGFGRVINYLTTHYPDKQITAVEKSSQLHTMLKQQNYSNVQLHHADILTFQPEQQFDLILWLWSGLTDFSQTEQPEILSKIQGLLSDNGTLIVETFPHDVTPKNGHMKSSQRYTLSAEGMQLHGYIPSPQEMAAYAKKLGLRLHETLIYTTDSGRERKLYLLTQDS